MQAVALDTKGGFDRFVEEQKKAPGEAVLTLVQFDTDDGSVFVGCVEGDHFVILDGAETTP